MPRLFAVALSVVLIGLVGAGCSRESRAARHIQRGTAYLEAKKLAEARIEFLNALRLATNEPTAILRLGEVHFQLGQIPAAGALLAKAEELGAADPDALFKLAKIFLAQNDPVNARQRAKKIIEKDPLHLDGLSILAETASQPGDFQEVEQRLEQFRAARGETAGYLKAASLLALRRGDAKAAEAGLQKAAGLEPDSSSIQMALGSFYWTQGESERARQAFEKGAKLAPDEPFEQLKWADFLIKTGALDEGKRTLAGIRAKMPDFIPALGYLAQIAFLQADYPGCESLAKEILAVDPNNFRALLLHAQLRLRKQEIPGGVEELKRLATMFPASAQVHHQLAMGLVLQKDAAAARASLRQALSLEPTLTEASLLLAELEMRGGNLPEAIALLAKLIERQPKLPQAHVLLADAYRARGLTNEVLQTHERFARTFPSNPQPLVFLGIARQEQKEFALARQAFEKALEVSTNNLAAFNQLVELGLTEKDFAAAERDARRAIAAQPTSAAAQVMLARAYWAQKSAQPAEAALLRAIELEPGVVQPYLLLVQIFMSSNRFDAAIQKLDEFLKLKPNDVLALMHVGMVHEKSRQFEKAAQAYESVLKVSPNNAAALNNLGHINAENLGQIDKGLELARKAHELAPNNPLFMDTLGWILHKRGDNAESLKLLRQASARVPTHPEIQFHLGIASAQAGEIEEARVAFESALQAQGDFPGRTNAVARAALLALDTARPDDQVLQTLETALRSDSNDVATLVLLARAYRARQEPAKAREFLELAMKKNPKAPALHLELAQVFLGAQQKSQAREALNQAVQLGLDPVKAENFNRSLR